MRQLICTLFPGKEERLSGGGGEREGGRKGDGRGGGRVGVGHGRRQEGKG